MDITSKWFPAFLIIGLVILVPLFGIVANDFYLLVGPALYPYIMMFWDGVSIISGHLFGWTGCQIQAFQLWIDPQFQETINSMNDMGLGHQYSCE